MDLRNAVVGDFDKAMHHRLIPSAVMTYNSATTGKTLEYNSEITLHNESIHLVNPPGNHLRYEIENGLHPTEFPTTLPQLCDLESIKVDFSQFQSFGALSSLFFHLSTGRPSFYTSSHF